MGDFKGTVQINNLNLGQGEFPEVERTLLFVGEGTSNIGTVQNVDTQSDLITLIGTGALLDNLTAAKTNAGQNWQAFAMVVAVGTSHTDILAAIDSAMDHSSPEMIVVTTVADAAADISHYHDKAMLILGQLGRQVAVLVAAKGIDTANQTWAEYFTTQETLIDGIAANRVAVIPQLHGNDIGVLAGRLCNRQTSIADTPMRVATGAVLALGATPVDSAGVKLPEATLSALSNIRYSTIQHYADYPGTYWADCPMLETPTGDFKVIEYLRVIMKIARAIRVQAIFRIGDRALNSTPPSIASNQVYFSRILREMSKDAKFAGQIFPGEIKKPEADAVLIQWKTKTKVIIYVKACPYNSPKNITANIVLDLSSESA